MKISQKNLLNNRERKQALKLARESLEAAIRCGRVPPYRPDDFLPGLKRTGGVFVTLKKNHQLRGCIGTLESDVPLWKSIPQYTIAAATSDPRFPPVRPSELYDIQIEVSILSDLREIKSVEEIVLGMHGVMVQRDRQGGVFLPQVAEETGWELEEFLENLCQHKAKLPPDAWKDKQTKLLIFEVDTLEEVD